MLALIVSAHPYSTRKFTRRVMHQACAKRQWQGNMALPGFNDLAHSVTPIFLLMDHFLYQISTFSEKMKKIYQSKVWIFFCKMHHRMPFFLALLLSVRRFQMPFEGLSFVKTLKTLELHWTHSTKHDYDRFPDSPSIF